ncbi:MAG: hypothetical protein LBP59_03785 [Planctomycetaceae bacterium]|jgi:hypothetical protein|nr:hypothetical protein [Planctomycetaceae bacterium]
MLEDNFYGWRYLDASIAKSIDNDVYRNNFIYRRNNKHAVTTIQIVLEI